MKFDLVQYLTDGVGNALGGVSRIKSVMKSPREAAFLAKAFANSEKAAKKRRNSEAAGRHVPSILIASVTRSCNLRCAGCYAHLADCPNAKSELTGDQWSKIFTEAADLGVSFVLLAGGEPTIRRDVLETAAREKRMIFPVFTNATLLDGGYIDFFDANRNMIPLLSLEGERSATDARRGEGAFDRSVEAMGRLHAVNALFGASITVTGANLSEVTSDDFLALLRSHGCAVVVYVEYVPADEGTDSLTLTDEQREALSDRIKNLREDDKMFYVSFPGDEEITGGCLAAGRGFFHINSSGGAEPCPFSPYSDVNAAEIGVAAALESPLFRRLSESGLLNRPHTGGCVLFPERERVKELAR